MSVAGGRGQSLDQKVEHYRREQLSEGATLKSGELVEVELEIDSKNDYEYVVFEDYKAAGFEPVEVRSGYNGNDLGGVRGVSGTTGSPSSPGCSRAASTAWPTVSGPRSPASSMLFPPGPRPCMPRS